MNRINTAFESAFRKIGLGKVQYKKRDVCFKITAMGLTGMPVEGIEKDQAKQAVSRLVEIWRKEDAVNVILMISAKKGIRIKDRKGRELLSYKIYNVANCTVDRENPEVFLFIARQRDGTNNCHAFYCNDKIQSEAICLCLSNAFHKAFEAWVDQNGILPSYVEPPVKQVPSESLGLCQNSNDSGNQPPPEKEDRDFPASSSHAKRNFENGRRPSTLSEASAFSFNSQADETFGTLLAVEEEEDLPTILKRDMCEWETLVEDKEKILSLLDGEEITWEDDSQC